MFGIEDAGIWMAYVLAFACLVFSIWFGITRWNREDKTDERDETDQETPQNDPQP